MICGVKAEPCSKIVNHKKVNDRKMAAIILHKEFLTKNQGIMTKPIYFDSGMSRSTLLLIFGIDLK